MAASLSDAWVGVALADLIEPESSHPVRVGDEGLAVWRSRSGALQVWEDRCPHRGMRLSFGFVEGERLHCLYHGWSYAPEGNCTFIPAHPELKPPRTICARTYPVAVACGIVLTTRAEDAPAPADGGGGWHGVRSLYLRAAPEEVQARLMRGDVLPGLEEVGPARFAGTHEGGEVAVALQPSEPGRSALHVAARGLEAAARLRLARYMLRARHAAEEERSAA